MAPWGQVERWDATTPNRELIAELGERRHAVILPAATAGDARPRGSLARDDRWAQLTFEV